MAGTQIRQRAWLCVTIGIRQSALPSEKYYTKEEVDELIEESGGGTPFPADDYYTKEEVDELIEAASGGATSIVPATADSLGGIKVGNGLNITEDGMLSVNSYEGEYTVTPGIEPQTLPTSGYVMDEDLEVGGIPYVEITNPEGGGTVIIG